MNFAYTRVSRDEQSTAMQLNALNGYKIDRHFTDEGVSGKDMDREQFKLMNQVMREGDTLIVYSLSRLGRNTLNLINYAMELECREINLVSHTESIDTRTPMGKMMFTIIAAFCQLERDVMLERTHQGIKAAKANGIKFGRKAVLTIEQEQYIKNNPQIRVKDLILKYGISKSTIMRVRRRP